MNHLIITTTGPMHEHDCARCVYIATVHEVKNYPRIWDAYWCPSYDGGRPTVIARYTSDPADYSSGLLIAQRGHDSTLALALQLGINRGVIETKYRTEI